MRNAGVNRNAKSNGSNGNGNGVTPCNAKSNAGSNASIYDNTDGYVMTGAERTEKSRKLKALKNKGVQTDKSMTLNEVRTLYATHFDPCNAECNEACNAGNAQIRENNHNPLPITQELKNIECVNNETLHAHAHAHTNFSHNLKSIKTWQAPSLDSVNALLRRAGFGRVLGKDEYGQMFAKFQNYNVSRELQGSFLATEQVRMDKLIDWIKCEKPVFAVPSSEISTPASGDNYADHIARIVAENRAYNEQMGR